MLTRIINKDDGYFFVTGNTAPNCMHKKSVVFVTKLLSLFRALSLTLKWLVGGQIGKK